MIMKKPTIREVARLAGVSPATVSRAINNTGLVTEETRRRIAEAIQESGYSSKLPLSAASEISSASGIVYFMMKCVSINVYSQLLNRQLILAAEKRGVNIVSADLEAPVLLTESVLQFHLRQARLMGAKGIIISGYVDKRMEPSAVQALASCEIPVVSISRSLFSSNYNFSHILTGSDRGGFQATHHLLENGRRHLMVISLPHHDGKVLGFEQAIQQFGASDIHYQIRAAKDDSYQSSAQVLEAALEEDPELDGILCCADEFAAHMLQLLSKLGKAVPSQVELIGYNDNLAPFLNPPISSVRVPLAEIADQALDILLDERTAASGSPVKSILLDPKLILR